MPLPIAQKYPVFPVWIYDESDYDHSAPYFAWCLAADKARLQTATRALISADFTFDINIGNGWQVEPNRVSRRPTAMATILRRAIAPYLEDGDPKALADIARILATHGFRLNGRRVEG